MKQEVSFYQNSDHLKAEICQKLKEGNTRFHSGFLSFAKNIGTNATRVAKNMNNKYTKKIPDSSKKSAPCDLIGNKTTDKITNIQKSPDELHSVELRSKTDENKIYIPKERYVSPEKKTGNY